MDKQKYLELYEMLTAAEFTKIVNKKTFRSKVNQIDKLRAKILGQLQALESKKADLMDAYQEEAMQMMGEIDQLQADIKEGKKDIKKSKRGLFFKQTGFNIIKIPVSAAATLREKPAKEKPFGKIKEKTSLEQKHYLDIIETSQKLKSIEENFSLQDKPIRKVFSYQLNKLKLSRLQKTSGLYRGLDQVRINTKELASKTMNFIKKPFQRLGAKSNAYLERKKNEIAGLKELLEQKQQYFGEINEDLAKKEAEYNSLEVPELSNEEQALEQSLQEQLKTQDAIKESYVNHAYEEAQQRVQTTVTPEDLAYAASLQGVDLNQEDLMGELEQVGQPTTPVVETFNPLTQDDLFNELNAINPGAPAASPAEPQPYATSFEREESQGELSFDDFKKQIEAELGTKQDQSPVAAPEPKKEEQKSQAEQGNRWIYKSQNPKPVEKSSRKKTPTVDESFDDLKRQIEDALKGKDVHDAEEPQVEQPGKWVYRADVGVPSEPMSGPSEPILATQDGIVPEVAPQTFDFMNKARAVSPNMSEAELMQLGVLFQSELMRNQMDMDEPKTM